MKTEKRTSSKPSSKGHRSPNKGDRHGRRVGSRGRRRRAAKDKADSWERESELLRALLPKVEELVRRDQKLPLPEPSPFTTWATRKLPLGQPLKGVDRVRFAGVGEDGEGNLHVRLVVGEGDRRRGVVVRAGDLASEPANVHRRLADAGGRAVSQASKGALITAVEAQLNEAPSFLVATQPGWSGDHKLFVLPYGVVGTSVDVAFAPNLKAAAYRGKFLAVGSSRQWRRRVGALLRGNALGMLAASAMLLSPLLDLLGEENFVLVLVGAPGSGKSTVIVVATSQWGAHVDRARAMALGSAETAKHTTNNLDYVLMAHNDLGAAIDDLRMLRVDGSRAKALEQLTLSLADGSERGRANVDGQGRFRAVVLTSANRSLQTEAIGSDYQSDRAILDRFVEVPLPIPNCAFEDLHGHADLSKLVECIKEGAIANAGAVGADFVRHLHAWVQADRQGCIDWLRARIIWFMANSQKVTELERPLRRFALIYAAGCLAIRFGLHPWKKKELAKALRACLAGHLRLTVSEAPGGPADKASATSRLLGLLSDWYRGKRSELRKAGLGSGLVADNSEVRQLPGFLYDHPARGAEVLLWERQFADLVRPVCSPDLAKQLLLEAGLIAVDVNANRRSFSVKRPIGRTADGGKWRPNVIALTTAALSLG